MKYLATLSALALMAAPAFAADPLEGRWLTAPDDNKNRGLVEVKPCGAMLCGTLVGAIDGSGASITSGPNIGRQIVWNTVNKGGGVYRGKVYSPDRGKTYNSKLVLSGGNLSVSGCVVGVCREGGIWTKQ